MSVSYARIRSNDDERQAMNQITYRKQDITCDHCQRVGSGDVVHSVGGWAQVKCLSCGWTSSWPEV